MNHITFSFLFITIFFLIFCLSSTTCSPRLLQARRSVMYGDDDDNDNDNDNNNDNDDNHNNNNDYSDDIPPTMPPDYVGIPMKPHPSKPDHSATDQHPPPARVIHPPPANPTTCSGMNRQELSNCIRRQVNRDLCKNYNIC